MWGAVIVMTPFESAVRGSLEGSHGGRAHVRDDHDGATALHHYRGLNYHDQVHLLLVGLLILRDGAPVGPGNRVDEFTGLLGGLRSGDFGQHVALRGHRDSLLW